MAKFIKYKFYFLAFIFFLSNSFAAILSEDILDESSIERLKAELSEIDILTIKSTTSANQPEIDSVQSSSSAIKKNEMTRPELKQEEKEQKIEETSDYINLDNYF